jgi:hypothetical protein
MISKYFLRAAVVMALSVILVPALEAQEPRTLTANDSGQGLTALDIEGHVGKMHILAGTSADIRVRVDVRASRDARSRGNPQNVDLRINRSGSKLEVSLAGDHKDLEEDWTLEIPAQLQVEAEFGVGDLNIQGVRGGLKAKVGVGTLNIDVPEGSIDAENGVGKIIVKSGTGSYGNVEMRTSVGNASVRVDGRQIRQQNRPPGPSEHIALNGSGRDQFKIHSGVGDAELTIGR